MDGSIFLAINVSVTQGGLTTFTRKPRGKSMAAARTNPYSPALTILIDALPFMGF